MPCSLPGCHLPGYLFSRVKNVESEPDLSPADEPGQLRLPFAGSTAQSGRGAAV
jgi:hypothetical protein